MFSKVNSIEQENNDEYMTISNADSFFENFDKKIQVKLSPPKTQERRYDNIPRISYEGKSQQSQVCKSLERVFQQCNNNPTIKQKNQLQSTTRKPQLPEPPDYWDDYSTRTKQTTLEDKGSTIRLGKYIETNKNLSFNQLKIIFNQQQKSNTSKVGKSLKFPPESFDLNNTNDQMEKITEKSMNDISVQKYNEPPEQQFKVIKKPSPLRIQTQKTVPLVDIFLENQKSNLQHYIFPKQNMNKQGSGYLSFHANVDDILKRSGSQHRNPSQSNHSRPKNQSSHTQLVQMNNNYSLSMAQLLKPRHRNNNSKNINENSATSLMSNTTQQAINKAILAKQINKMKPQQSRNVSPQTNITPFVSSRLQKQKTQISYIQNKSFENNLDHQTNLALYFCQDINKLKRVGTNSRSKFTLHNDSCRDENTNPNPTVYLNFADFKKALKTNKQQKK